MIAPVPVHCFSITFSDILTSMLIRLFHGCKDSKFIYPLAGHVVTGNLKMILDSRIHNSISKGPMYRFPSYIDFKRSREDIAFALNDF